MTTRKTPAGKIPMDALQSDDNHARIMVVDDDPDERQALETILSDGGFGVTSASDGLSALRSARKNTPDAILVGVHLHNFKALDLCRQFKANPRTSAAPLICICDRQDPESRVRGLAAGCVDSISRPYPAEEVLLLVRTHIRLSRLERHLAGQEASAAGFKGVEFGERLRFEQMISNLSARFINMPSDQLDKEIEIALQMVLEFFQVDRVGLLHTLPGKDEWKITHVAYSEYATPVPIGTILPRSINPWAFDRLTLEGKVVSYSKIDDMPDAAHVDKQTWRDWGIRSNLTLPVMKGESLVQVISINAMRSERVWPEVFLPRLQMLGEIFVNALERRKVEQALRKNEAQLTLAAASAEAGLWSIYADTGRLWATEKLRDIFNFTPDEDLSFERFLEKVHPDDRQMARETFDLCLRTRELVRLEYRILLPDGRVRWVVARGRSFPGTAEQSERVMGVAIDITERMEIETRLNEQLDEIQRLKEQLEQENLYLRDEIVMQKGHEGIVAHSMAMKRILAQVEQVAPTDATVLISGETGTGKELLARRIHALSGRKERTLVTISCANLPPTLIESELFGREKGAYTGALTRMAGRFEVAHRSTLFLDEIGELPLDLQAKLLRVLEEGRFERLGSTQSQKVDVRIIAATNRNLEQEIAAGRFRSDLFYRLSVFPIAIPPLRERMEDIPPLVWMFVKQNEKKLGKRIDRIPRKSMEALKRYAWPGNARELRNIVEHAMITCSGGVLAIQAPDQGADSPPSTGTLEEVDRRHILRVLEKTGWRVTGKNGAAEILGLKRTTLQAKMKKLGIKRPSG